MMSCDYNGWNDTPEDEREALDVYEAAAEKARLAAVIAQDVEANTP